MRLRARLLSLVSLALLPGFVLILVTALEQRRGAEREAEGDALRVARLAARHLQDTVRDVEALLTALGHIQEIRGGAPATCGRLMSELLRAYPRYVNLGTATAGGEVVCSGVPFRPPVSIADRRYFQRTMQGGRFSVGEVQRGRVTGRRSIHFGYPLSNQADGRIQGVIVAALDLGWLDTLADQAALPPGSQFLVVDDQGVVVSRQRDPEQLVGRALPQAPIIRAMLERRAEGTVALSGLDSVDRLFAFTPVPGDAIEVGLYVAVGIRRDTVLAPVLQGFVRNLGLFGLVSALGLAAAWFGGELLVLRRTGALVETTKRLAAGDLTARTGMSPAEGELGQLGHAVDEMARALQERDVQLERQRDALYQSEKLSAMSGLLTGVAHELNNPLAVVLGQSSLLASKLGDTPHAERAQKIRRGAERCSRIVQNFVAMARRKPPERTAVAVATLLREAVELLAYQFRVDDVEVVFDLADELPELWADRDQLRQVVVNLLVNAQQAMHAIPGPRRIALTAEYEPGAELLRVRVADNGVGVPFEVQSQIFEPFFTTKPLGVGTGIGLALCRRIVEAHRGTIRLDSEPGQGATFVLEFPVEQVPGAPGDPGAGEPAARGRQILVVDDEPDAAETLADLLREDDHQVEIAINGMAALRKILAHDYDLIFSDLRMPVLDGPGLYRQLRQERPHLLKRVIFVTGDTISPQALELLQDGRPVQMTKPFVLEEVRAAIRQALLPSP